MHAEHAETDMERIGAEVFKRLADLAVLFHGGGQIRLADVDVVFLDAVDEDLNREVLAADLLDAGDDLADEAGAVFKALGTVLVVAVVSLAGEEGLADVVAGSIDLHSIKTEILHLFGTVDEVCLHQLDFFRCQMLGKGGGIHRRSRGIEAAEGTAHAAELIADIAAGGMNAVHNRLDMRICDLGGTGSREIVVELQKVLHPDHLYAAFGKVGIVLDRFLLAALLGIGTGSRLHHAVAELEPAELPRAEHRGKIGIRVAEIVILRIAVSAAFSSSANAAAGAIRLDAARPNAPAAVPFRKSRLEMFIEIPPILFLPFLA